MAFLEGKHDLGACWRVKQLGNIHGWNGEAEGQRGTGVVLSVKVWMHAEFNAASQ